MGSVLQLLRKHPIMKAIGCAATLILVIVLLSRGEQVEAKKGPKVTHKVWFDITIGGEAAGRIEIGLSAKQSPRRWRTLWSWRKSLRARATKGASSTGSSKISCFRVEILHVVMALEVAQFTERSLLMRTSSCSTMALAGCRWPTLERTPTAPSSSSQ